jgi:hypothetical protein
LVESYILGTILGRTGPMDFLWKMKLPHSTGKEQGRLCFSLKIKPIYSPKYFLKLKLQSLQRQKYARIYMKSAVSYIT